MHFREFEIIVRDEFEGKSAEISFLENARDN